MIPKQKVLILIPTYNEALVIEETIRQVFEATDAIEQAETHILVFDSASQDATQTIIQNLQQQYPRLHLQSEPQKSGLGSAYLQAMRAGLDNHKADVVFEFDADLSHKPQYLAPMLAALEQVDVVIGSRYVRGGAMPADWAWNRKFLSKIGNYVARLSLHPKYKDWTSGFRATKAAALQQALPASAFISNHYAYKLELFWNLHQAGALIQEYPIQFVDREKGDSKLPKNGIYDALRVIFHLRRKSMQTYLKMCLVGFSGMLLQFLVYNLLRSSLPSALAVQFSVLAAISSNFIFNNRYTFKERRLRWQAGISKKLGLFALYSLFQSSVQAAWCQLFFTIVGRGFFKENLVLLSAMLLGSLVNYLIYSRVIWRR